MRCVHASTIVRIRRGVTVLSDAVESDEKQMTSQRPAAGRTVQSGSPSRCTGASGIPGTASSDGKRFSKTTTS